MKLKAVSVVKKGSVVEESFRSEQVEDVIFGERGNVRLIGGPTFTGQVREAVSLPLGKWFVPNPEDRGPEKLARRATLGREIRELAGAEKVPDPFGLDEEGA